jgi:hypothetical protein
MDFNIPAFRHCLPSVARQWSFTIRCLATDVLSVTISYVWRNSQRREISEVRKTCRKYSYLFPYKIELSYTMPQDKKRLTSTLCEIRCFHMKSIPTEIVTLINILQYFGSHNQYIGMNLFRWNSEWPSYLKQLNFSSWGIMSYRTGLLQFVVNGNHEYQPRLIGSLITLFIWHFLNCIMFTKSSRTHRIRKKWNLQLVNAFNIFDREFLKDVNNFLLHLQNVRVPQWDNMKPVFGRQWTCDHINIRVLLCM